MIVESAVILRPMHQIMFILISIECAVDTDLMFVLDESGSIGHQNFQQVKSFVYNFTQQLLVNTTRNDSRVGVITFDSGAMEYIPLNSTVETDDLLQQISALPYDGGGTNTAYALEIMREQPWREGISILRLAIILTDGRSNDQQATIFAAETVHNHTPPIAVYAIGVGPNIDEIELRTIASRPETYSHLDSFATSMLESTRASYSYQICFTGKYTILCLARHNSFINKKLIVLNERV